MRYDGDPLVLERVAHGHASCKLRSLADTPRWYPYLLDRSRASRCGRLRVAGLCLPGELPQRHGAGQEPGPLLAQTTTIAKQSPRSGRGVADGDDGSVEDARALCLAHGLDGAVVFADFAVAMTSSFEMNERIVQP